ncbi:hypothetical protein GCM10027275_25320 [Rhabdobacter roseus]|uniref:Peptidase S8/S53 domain-containing protein n=1 Tax=Rhabdobacter roseus TaxID=1655419 RepID=A0A840TM42_9BACT|nr:S8 family peptidase [Rhabdobacter roseus]MBB5284474.1 hypothetical protein [Rhabdobacter roseus]
MAKPHLLYTKPTEAQGTYKQPARNPGNQPEDKPEPNYGPMQDDFRKYLSAFQAARMHRHQARSLQVPAHLDYIRITFFDVFDNAGFEARYRDKFGLVAVQVDHFGRRVLFAIQSESRFRTFLHTLQAFVDTISPWGDLSNPDRDILFIKEFELLTTVDILPNIDEPSDVLLSLVEKQLEINTSFVEIQRALFSYLDSQSIDYESIPENNTIQLWNVALEQLRELADNFDILYSVYPNSLGLVSPGRFGTATRSFGFTANLPPDNAPIIGVIDTGISDQTPLADLIINSQENDPYDLTGTNSRVDNWDKTWGHGTGVAGIAAFGEKLYPAARGAIQADAWLLSIKVLDDRVSRVSDRAIRKAIMRAYHELGVRIFTLTISERIKNDNETVSALAYMLDVLACECDLDILICIASGNMRREIIDLNTNTCLPYPNHFIHADNNIHVPAESMNNLTVGATANNLNPTLQVAGLANDVSFPAVFTTKCHVDFDTSGLTQNQRNKQFGKPDILYYGGDHERNGEKQVTGISVLTPKIGQYWMKETGTSYATPFVANLAARILSAYPKLSMQTVKALIINSASLPRLDNTFAALPKSLLNRVLGKGTPDASKCLSSTDHQVTIILEDSIVPEHIGTYTLKFPGYLQKSGRATGLLAFHATLCFKFRPIQHRQSTYCPVHIAFGIFKNKPLDEINGKGMGPIRDEKTKEVIEKGYKLREPWSQDPYYRGKLLCNTQKVSFVVGKKDILNEDFTFKVAVNSKLNKLLTAAQKAAYATTVEFSLVIRIEERPYKNQYIGSLYNGLKVENDLQVLTTLDADLEAEAESEL